MATSGKSRRRKSGSKGGWKSKQAKQQKRLKAALIGGALVIVVGMGAFWLLRPKMPDYEADPNAVTTEEEVVKVTDFIPATGEIRKDKLVQGFLAMNGGQDKILQMRSVRLDGKLLFGEADAPVDLFISKMKPDKARMKLELNNADLTVGVNGTEVWRMVEMPNRPTLYEYIEGDEALSFQRMGNFHTPFVNVVLGLSGEITGIERSEFEGMPAIKVDFTQEIGEPPATAYLDAETLLQVARIETDADGVLHQTRYENYEAHGGMMMPMRITVEQDGELRNQLTIERVSVNPGVLSGAFAPPPQLADTAE